MGWITVSCKDKTSFTKDRTLTRDKTNFISGMRDAYTKVTMTNSLVASVAVAYRVSVACVLAYPDSVTADFAEKFSCCHNLGRQLRDLARQGFRAGMRRGGIEAGDREISRIANLFTNPGASVNAIRDLYDSAYESGMAAK